MAAGRVEVAVGGIAFDGSGRVLLVERGHPPATGRWTIPGGRVELGETVREACARELAEETGLEVEVGPLVEVVDRIGAATAGGPPSYHFVIVDFLATVRGGRLTAGSDVTDARFCDAAELASLPLTDGLEPVLDRARELAGG